MAKREKTEKMPGILQRYSAQIFHFQKHASAMTKSAAARDRMGI
jgi:hypothetical protein